MQGASSATLAVEPLSSRELGRVGRSGSTFGQMVARQRGGRAAPSESASRYRQGYPRGAFVFAQCRMEGQSARGLRAAITRAADNRGISVETVAGECIVGVN